MAVNLVSLTCLLLATIAVSQVAGFPQTSSNTGRLFFRGQEVPTLGDDPLELELHRLREQPDVETEPRQEERARAEAQKSLYEGSNGGVALEEQLARLGEKNSRVVNEPQNSEEEQEDGEAGVEEDASEATESSSAEEEEDEEGDGDYDDEDSGSLPSTVRPLESPTPSQRAQPWVAARTVQLGSNEKGNNYSRQPAKQNDAPQNDDDGDESGERLFKMMVDLAEHPAQWQKVHQELQQLDKELVASRKLAATANSSSSTPVKLREGVVALRHPNLRLVPRIPDTLLLENEMDKARERYLQSLQKLIKTTARPTTTTTTAAPSTPAKSGQAEHHGGKHTPQFAYHRVTSSPYNEQGTSSSQVHHSHAFVAVSDVTPPKLRGKNLKEVEPQKVASQFAIDATENASGVKARLPLHRVSSSASAPASTGSLDEPDTPVPVNISVDDEELEIEQLLLSLRTPPIKGQWNHQRNKDWVREKLMLLERLHSHLRQKWQIDDGVERPASDEAMPPKNHPLSAHSQHHSQSPLKRQ
ncbi:uncharacterized protein LOC132196890 isoform X2 [Neocloeon triangulifer]|uniref:uncharacterized protein LOC132196890 isoform X2 n=1 Tax=Neocloeon triangulifer TaxID=2078957 RepID=UPI00286F0BDB|nr:uncharacterized protein LOC132196890 isoform X2 [Neocloeon triangulifer]